MLANIGFVEVFALIAILVGGGLSALALVSPDKASRIVRLIPEPAQREGRAELRANYGGLFGGLHVFALIALFASPQGAWAAAAVGAGWLGLGAVRFAFMRADNAVTRYNVFGAAFELVMGFALFTPLLF